MTRFEEVRAEMTEVTLRLEALGWRLAALARQVAATRERLDRELGTKATQPLQLRTPVKGKPREST